jgi:hypothetical protein
MTIRALLASTFLLFFAPSFAQAPPPADPVASGFIHVVLPNTLETYKLAIRALSDQREYLLVRSSEAPEGFGAWVPEGEYEIVEIGESGRDILPRIPVVANRFTDLGGLMRFDIGGNETVFLPFRHREFASIRGLSIAQVKSRLTSTDPIEWTPTRPPKPQPVPVPYKWDLGVIVNLIELGRYHANRPASIGQFKKAATIDEFMTVVRATRPPLSYPASDSAKNSYYGADLGQIRVRSPRGEWTSIDTGTMSMIGAVGVDEGEILAGTQTGTLLGSTDGGKSWKTRASLEPHESIIDIDRAGPHWIVLSARLIVPADGGLALRRLRVFLLRSDEPAGLTPIRTIDIPPEARGPDEYGLRGAVLGGQYLLNAVTALERLDLGQMTWQRIDYPVQASKFGTDPRSGVISIFREKGWASKLYLSKDRGESWVQLSRPGYGVEDLHFSTAETAEATVWVSRGTEVALEVLRYDGGRDNWSRVWETPPLACASTFTDAEYLHRFCRTRRGDILRFNGEGFELEFAVN